MLGCRLTQLARSQLHCLTSPRPVCPPPRTMTPRQPPPSTSGGTPSDHSRQRPRVQSRRVVSSGSVGLLPGLATECNWSTPARPIQAGPGSPSERRVQQVASRARGPVTGEGRAGGRGRSGHLPDAGSLVTFGGRTPRWRDAQSRPHPVRRAPPTARHALCVPGRHPGRPRVWASITRRPRHRPRPALREAPPRRTGHRRDGRRRAKGHHSAAASVSGEWREWSAGSAGL